MANYSVETPVIHYRLTPESTGVKLEIWEPAAAKTTHQAPYHFFVSYQLTSVTEAQYILDQYLLDNDVAGAVCLEANDPQVQSMIASTRYQTNA